MALPPLDTSMIFALAVGDRDPDQLIVVVQVDRNDPGGTRPGERRERSLLHRAARVP